MFHKNQLVVITRPEYVDPQYASIDGILIGRITGFRSHHRVAFNKLIFLKKGDEQNRQIWLKFHDDEFNLKNLQPDIKHKEHRILIPKELVRHLSQKETILYTERFGSAEKHAKEFKLKKATKIIGGLYSAR